MSASLFQRLGGSDGIAAIVEDAVDRHAANPLLAPRFRGRDLPELKSLSQAFLGAAAGGPSNGEPPPLRPAHAGMQFAGPELSAVIGDVVATMREQGLGAAEVGEVVGLLRHPAPARDRPAGPARPGADHGVQTPKNTGLEARHPTGAASHPANQPGETT